MANNSCKKESKSSRVAPKGVTKRDVNVKEHTTLQGSKYALGLLSLARKCQNVRKAKEAPFNRVVVQKIGFFGFLPLPQMPEKIEDHSVPHEFDYFDMHRKIRADGRPKFSGLQLPVSSKLKII